jgi:NCAIR mutase (PurE)-related protein
MGYNLSMKSHLLEILHKVQKGELSPDEACKSLEDLPYKDLDFAKVDHHRELRRGFPEIIYGQGKTPDQIVKISKEILKKGSNLLITRTSKDVFDKLKKDFPDICYNTSAKTITFKQKNPHTGKGKVIIITAGTSDIGVAEEAFVTCEILGNDVEKILDVGVAGIHRLFGEYHRIKTARVLIVVAGMEGALPGVIAGMTNVPVIAVPSSVGYGASLNGFAALLTMLNSCAGGVGVVNIDNGFGAAYLASLINHL